MSCLWNQIEMTFALSHTALSSWKQPFKNAYWDSSDQATLFPVFCPGLVQPVPTAAWAFCIWPFAVVATETFTCCAFWNAFRTIVNWQLCRLLIWVTVPFVSALTTLAILYWPVSSARHYGPQNCHSLDVFTLLHHAQKSQCFLKERCVWKSQEVLKTAIMPWSEYSDRHNIHVIWIL